MRPELFMDIAVMPALRLLPPRMDSPEARAMIVAIALQESRLEHRHQVGGPAHGFLQFERGGGVKGVLTHTASSPYLLGICRDLCYQPTVAGCFAAIEHNDVLACVFARLLLWTLPDRLPMPSETSAAWHQYLKAWRPGKPHPETWHANYAQAWTLVAGDTP